MPRIVMEAEERKREILLVAKELFNARGYASVTMQEIVDRLGVAKGTVYYHFASKAALLDAIVEDIVEGEYRRMEALLHGEACRGLGAIDKLKLLLAGDSRPAEDARIIEELHGSGDAERHARQFGRFIERLGPLFAEAVGQGVAEGVFAADLPLECSEFILAGTQFITDLGFYPWTEEQLSRRAAALPALVEAQLGAPKGSFAFLKP